MNSFANLRAKYGQKTQDQINSYINASVSSAKYHQHATFGHRCKAHNLLPRGFHIKPPIRTVAGYNLAEKCGHLFLKQWIGTCHSKIRSEDRKANNIYSELSNVISPEDLVLVSNIANGKKQRVSNTVRSRQITKFEALRSQARLEAKNKRPPPQGDLVLNVSSRQLTEGELSVLSKGLNFVPTNTKVPVKDLLLKVECATSRLSPSDAQAVRHDIANAVSNFRSSGHSNLTSHERKAITDLRKDDTIRILPADKGRKTVVMDADTYNNKVMDLLNDTATYVTLKRDPTPATEIELNRLLRKLVKEKKITDEQYRHLHASGGQTPRFYGLPKVHKPGIPLRPIVSFTNSPTYNVSRFISNILAPVAMDNPYRAKNATQVISSITDLTLEDSEEMVSFDVVALFTSIPTDLACSVALSRLSQDSDLSHRTPLTPGDIVTLLRFCLETAYFSYAGLIYKQVFGTAMGSPVSATIADIVMRHIEETALNTFPFDVKLWRRYVDDVLALLKREHSVMLLDHLNTIDPHIQFTLERESDGRLPFLDIQLSRKPDGSLITTVHRKPTHTDSYLHFESDHPPMHKAAVVRTLLGRVETHVTEDTDKTGEKQRVIDALHRCGYMNHFIEKSRPSPPTNVSDDGVERKYRTPIPYIKGLSEQVSRILRRHDINTTFVPRNSLRDLLVHPKDIVPTTSQAGVIYSVPCKDCGKPYIGETQRRLCDRLKEHKKAVKNADFNTSALAEHVWTNDHAVDWENTKILDKAQHWRERKYRESVAIACKVPNINRDKGLELPVQYLQIIKSTR